MRFKFKAIKKDGEVYKDFVNAKNENELYKLLKSEGSTLVSAEIDAGGENIAWLNSLMSIFNRIHEQEKISFAHNLSAMIEAGLPMARALSVINRQTRNKKFKEILSRINEELKKGQTLSSGLALFPKVFNTLFISMVHAGEESGNLAKSLDIIANQMDRVYKLKKKIKGALMYPSIIIIAMTIVGILMLIFVVPTLTSTFQELNVELPKSTQAIITISNFLKNNTILAILIMILSITGVVYFKRTPKGKRIFDWIFLRIPIIGFMVKETNSAHATRTLSSLLTSGVEVVKSLEITAEVVQNTYFKEVLVTAQKTIQQGATLSSVFKEKEDLYPPLVNEMMAVGEETGRLPELLMKVAEFYEDEVDQKTKNMSTIIEPFLMVFIGAVVGFFAVSMISPMYSLTSGI